MKRLLYISALTLALTTPCYEQILSPILFGTAPAGGGGGGTALVSAQTVGTSRNDFTGCVGFKFTIGGSPITVTDLGRWVVSGNSGTHTVYIVNGSTGALIVSGAVNTSGATSGQYKYVSVTPTVLSAGTLYGLESDETNGADTWYSNDTTITLTAAATYDYSFHAGCPGSAGSDSTGGTSYGPLNLKY